MILGFLLMILTPIVILYVSAAVTEHKWPFNIKINNKVNSGAKFG